jgi:2-polyprenyl-3-methyl-5-hydroxy-6-metoxy-1,4-benzoquinol methylase
VTALRGRIVLAVAVAALAGLALAPRGGARRGAARRVERQLHHADGAAVLASIRPVDRVLEAFRSGNGVPYADYGDDLHEAQAAFTRPLFENLLGKESLPAVPEIHERLLTDPPARIADFACGQGRSSIEIARAYAKVRVDGIDSDRASIERARASTSSAAGSRTG